jgi:hypothetical protein
MDQDITRSDAWNCIQRTELQKALSESNASNYPGPEGSGRSRIRPSSTTTNRPR